MDANGTDLAVALLEPSGPASAASPASATRRRPPRRSTKLHRWTGWALMLWVAFEALTGSYLAIGNDIQHWLDRGWYRHTAGDVGLDAAIDAAESVTADGRVRFVTFPGHDSDVYELQLATPGGEGYTAYVDPGTGQVNHLKGDHRSTYQLVLGLHADLNRSEILGVKTPTILGWLAIAWLANLVVGYRASRPHRRSLRHAFRVRRARGRYTFNLDLHKAVGLAIVVPLLAIVVTGIMYEFSRQSRAVVDAVTPGPLNGDDSSFRVPFSTPTVTGRRLPAQSIVETLAQQGVALDHLQIPIGNPAGTYQATVDVGGYNPIEGPFGGHGKTALAYVDQYSGALLAIDDSRDDSLGEQLFGAYKGGIHFGTFGGILTRLGWSLIGLGAAALVVTAAAMRADRWRKRWRRAHA